MFCKFTIFFTYLCLVSAKKSFTLILDTTSSMEEEIDAIKFNLLNVLSVLGNLSEIDNFILLPFNDPDVGPPMRSTTAEALLTSLDTITVKANEGGNCPENCLSGIEQALEVSSPESYIFLFTDAYAEDKDKFAAVQNLCKSTRSQVVTVLSGNCYPSESTEVGDINVYYDIAKACSGAVLRLDAANFRQSFKFIKEMIKVEWNDIVTHDSFPGQKEIMVSADSSTSDFIVAVHGDYPMLQIVNGAGQKFRIDKIVDTIYLVVVRVINSGTADYRLMIRSQGSTTATIYRRNKLNFQFGFSTRSPKSLKETSSKPIPAWVNYILVKVPSTDIKLNSIELDTLDGAGKNLLTLREIDENAGLYVTSAFFEPEKSFQISVSGHYASTYQAVTVPTKVMEPQKKTVNEPQWIKPNLEILEPDTTLIEFDTQLIVISKVTGYPKPDIVWEDESGATIPSEDTLIEIPSVYVSYATINNVKNNGTISCKAKNSEGEDMQSVDIFVHRTISFNVIQTPKDEIIEYNTDGKLYCEVSAYPEAELTWYHNDSLLENSNRVYYIPEDKALTIKSMTLEDAGDYRCEISNEFETKLFTAIVTISGLEPPEIEIENSEIVVKPGDWTAVECKIIKGKPQPNVTWKYKWNDDNFTNVPDGVIVEEITLKIPYIKLEHDGTYRCEAENDQGKNYRDVTVNVQYAPVIKNNRPETLTVKEGDTVDMICEVDAVPNARVHWEWLQDDVIMAFDVRHTTDEKNRHSFEALWKDSGKYHCIAENNVGRAEKIITVIVLVAPYIQPPNSKNITVKTGDNVQFACNVLYGNPVPSTKWEFIALNSSATILSRGTSSNTLEVKNVSRENEGSYQCLADNEVGSDSIRIYLKIH